MCRGHGHGYMHRGEVGCCGPGTGRFGRRFFTEKERLQWLEDYKTNLENELAAVKEEIVKSKK